MNDGAYCWGFPVSTSDRHRFEKRKRDSAVQCHRVLHKSGRDGSRLVLPHQLNDFPNCSTICLLLQTRVPGKTELSQRHTHARTYFGPLATTRIVERDDNARGGVFPSSRFRVTY
jgi:hypothetical protein